MKNIEKREERIMMVEKLYCYDMNNDYVYITPLDDYSDFIMDTINYICSNLVKIDNTISSSLVNYRINRLSYVDRAIIRLATAEMILGLPATVAINEALEIVKIYTDEGDGNNVRFVNKVLDNISKNIER